MRRMRQKIRDSGFYSMVASSSRRNAFDAIMLPWVALVFFQAIMMMMMTMMRKIHQGGGKKRSAMVAFYTSRHNHSIGLLWISSRQ